MIISGIINTESIWLPEQRIIFGYPETYQLEDLFTSHGIVFPDLGSMSSVMDCIEGSSLTSPLGRATHINRLNEKGVLYGDRFIGYKYHTDFVKLTKKWRVLGSGHDNISMAKVATRMLETGALKDPKDFIKRFRKNFHNNAVWVRYDYDEVIKQYKEYLNKNGLEQSMTFYVQNDPPSSFATSSN